jgi:hypothetical protein
MNTQGNFYKANNQFKITKNNFPQMSQTGDLPKLKNSPSPDRRALTSMAKMKIVPGVVTNYNIQNLNVMDTEKLKEELIKCKNEMNKKNKEFHMLKIAYLKLDSENKRNLKIIEEVLQEAARQKGDEIEEDQNVKNLLADTLISSFHVGKLKEVRTKNRVNIDF